MNLVILAMVAAIGGLEFGYDTGIVSSALLELKEDFLLTNLEKESIVSVTVGTAIVGSGIGSYMADKVGRRWTIVLSGAFFVGGALGLALARSFAVLMVGRALVGIGIGVSSMVVPIFLSETAPASIRGIVVTTNSIFITGGQFLASVMGAGMYHVDHGWRWLFGVAAIPAILQMVGFIWFLPESPVFLKRKNDEALLHLQKEDEDEDEEAMTLGELWKDVGVRRAFLVGVVLQVVQQLCGINIAMYYAGTILVSSGFSIEKSVYLNMAVAGTNFLGTIGGFFLVDRAGRRWLTLVSMVGVLVTMALIALMFWFRQEHSERVVGYSEGCPSSIYCTQCVLDDACMFYANGTSGQCLSVQHLTPSQKHTATSTCPESKVYAWVIFGLILLFLLFFAPGIGSTAWTINSEIHRPKIRALAVATSTAANWISNLIVSFTFLTLLQSITPVYTFVIYALVPVIAFIYFYFELPETRGVPLDKVPALFERK